MQVHGSCAALAGAGVLLVGPPGSGKSDLVLRLLDRGFMLVADDRVEIDAGRAAAPAGLAGLLEVRGLGILQLAHLASARLALVADLGARPARLPAPAVHGPTGLPLIALDPWPASAPALLARALACLAGGAAMRVGAFAP